MSFGVRPGRWAAIVWTLVALAVASDASGGAGNTVFLDAAPGQLGAFRAEGMVLMDASEDGKELVFLPLATGVVHTFLESGARWGDPVQLYDEQGMPFSQRTPGAIDVGGGTLALAGMRSSYLFDLRRGRATAHSSELDFAADVEWTPSGWAVGLQNMPIHGRILGREQFDEDEIPRVVLLDDDLEIGRTGLIEEELPPSGSIGAARRLKLAWEGRRLYAAELANYRIYELDKRLRLRAVYRDPELSLEEGVDQVDEGDRRRIERTLEKAMAKQGKDLGRSPGARPVALVSESFDYQPVIRSVAWDDREHRLLVLLAAGVVGDAAALDILDPTTGELRRLALRLPSGAVPQTLGQVVAGHDYLWFRNLVGQNPIYRLDRAQLFERGQRLTLPEISLFESWGERETVEDVVAPAEER